MPVIRRQAIGYDAHLGPGVGLNQNLLKYGVVSGLLKQQESPDTTVQDMIGEVSSSEARAARYEGQIVAILSRKDSRPLFLAPFLGLYLCCLALGFSAMQGVAHAAGSERSVGAVEEESITKGVEAVIEDVTALALLPLTMDRYDALKLGGAMAVVGVMFAADRPIYDLVQRNSTSKGREVADKFNGWGSPGTLMGLNAGVIAIGVASESYGASSKLKDTGLVSFEAEGFAIAATSALKLVTGRARPESNQGTTHFRPFTGVDGSFASTHASASFAVATVFAERYQGAGLIAYPLAVLISGARVYTNKHFSSDVVAGALIGYGLGHFINGRHSADPMGWQIHPMPMDRGMGGGLTLGRQF